MRKVPGGDLGEGRARISGDLTRLHPCHINVSGGGGLTSLRGAPPPPHFQYDHRSVLLADFGLLGCGVREVLCFAGGALRCWVVVVVGLV